MDHDQNKIEPLVSVGVPTYNRAKGLRQTLKSITAQAYKNLEIIVSDNCSPGEDTQQVVREFMNKDSRIYYYRQEENKGPFFNFQFVLKKASGEYFMWAADDDEWDKTYIEKCLKKLTGNTVLCYSEPIIRDFTNKTEILMFSDMATKGLSKLDGVKKVLINQRQNTEFYGVMKSDIAKKYVFRLLYGDDHVFLFYISLKGEIDKIEPGLFVSGVHSVEGLTMEKSLENLFLHKSNRYFGYVYQMLSMIYAAFRYGDRFTIFEKLKIFCSILYRFWTPHYRHRTHHMIKELLINISKGKV